MGRSRNHTSERGVDPAAQAGLVYTSDEEPGIRRVRRGRRFEYFGPTGTRIRKASELERIRRLAIPPAWEHVWISTRPRGHLQATGRDARGRKQHRYHARWRETRDADKFDRMADFARTLPRVRRRVAADLRREGLPKEKVVATVVRLLEKAYLRIGNEEYAKENRSFGLTTLRDRHVDVRGSTVRFLFRGKSGVEVSVGVEDRRVARVIKRLEELPGQRLFQYVDADGEHHSIASDDVNQYIREATGGDFTAKDFRTWAGTLLAACALREAAGFESEAEAKRRVIAAIDEVAHKLGHTRAVCRRAYIHPAVVASYMAGAPVEGTAAAVAALIRESRHRKVSKDAARLYPHAQGKLTRAA
jgi:DNA topoisomerase I